LKRLFLAAFLAALAAIFDFQAPVSGVAPRVLAAPKIPTSAILSRKIAETARCVATRRRSVGYCFRGVKRALGSMGVTLTGHAAWMAREQLQRDARFTEVPMKDLQVGDILVHGRNRSHPYGHIAVYLGDNKEASDHVQKLVRGITYGGTTVFRVRNTSSQLSMK
jgi:hypothetical protein